MHDLIKEYQNQPKDGNMQQNQALLHDSLSIDPEVEKHWKMMGVIDERGRVKKDNQMLNDALKEMEIMLAYQSKFSEQRKIMSRPVLDSYVDQLSIRLGYISKKE